MNKTKNNNKGITLIALVITVIVMLILVAVTITMAVNGGLFEYASNAGARTNEAIENEQQLANLEANMTVDELIDKYTGGGTKGVDTNLLNIGDYVNYPVTYTNVESGASGNWIAENKFADRWRVLSKETDEEGNVLYVKLISAGVPLGYYHGNDSSTSIAALTTNFLKTEITTTETEYKFCRCGFENVVGATLESTFVNNFTDKVQALTKTELDKAVIELGGSETMLGTKVNDEKYKDLFALSCTDEEGMCAIYWLASTSEEIGEVSLYRIKSNESIAHGSAILGGVRVVVYLNPNVQFTPATENINDTTTWDISI